MLLGLHQRIHVESSAQDLDNMITHWWSLLRQKKKGKKGEGDFVQSKSTQPWSVSSGQAVLLVTIYLKGLCQG